VFETGKFLHVRHVKPNAIAATCSTAANDGPAPAAYDGTIAAANDGSAAANDGPATADDGSATTHGAADGAAAHGATTHGTVELPATYGTAIARSVQRTKQPGWQQQW